MRVPFVALAEALFLALIAAEQASGQAVVANVSALNNGHYGSTSGATVFLQGFYNPGDGGGGTLVSAAALSLPSTVCMTANGKTSNTSKTLNNVSPFPIGLSIGMLVTGPGISSDAITAYSVSQQTITVATAADSTAGKGTFQFTGPNNGFTFTDKDGNCFTRVNPTYSQKEWGVFSDGQSSHLNETANLQNWLNANQPHIAVAGNTVIEGPLYCGTDSSLNIITDGAVIQGSPTQGVAEDKTVLPTFLITADPNSPGNFTNSAMLVMPAGTLCAIHAVGLIASSPATGSTYNTVNADGKSDLIADHSYLSGGYNNVDAEGNGDNANLEIYDSSLNNAVNDNALIKTPNSKVVRSAISGAGADNLYFSSSDIVIADNIIQQAQGWGINAYSARLMRITGNYFDNNGKQPVTTSPAMGAVRIDNSANLTICGNTFHRSGGGGEGVSGVITSHIYFAGTDDAISLCGNVYLPGETLSVPIVGLVRPDYDFDADPAATLTNITIADNPAQQNVAATGGPQNLGVFSPNAATLLAASVNPQVARNSLTGFTISNDPTVGTKVNITGGSAADSTNSATISLPNGCSVDLAQSTNGLGGLDVGNVHQNMTYYFFAVSGPGGSPGCMASASPVPSFQNVVGASYRLTQTANTLQGSKVVYNAGGPTEGSSGNGLINPLAGFAVGDEVTGDNIPACSPTCPRITSLSSYELGTAGSTSNGSNVIQGLLSVANVSVGMSVSDGTTNDQYIPQSGTNGNYVTGVDSPSCTPNPPFHCVTIANGTGVVGQTGIPVYFGGNFTVTLDTPANGSTALGSNATIKVHTGLYRMVGALYTTANTNVVSFTQDGDTFYLNVPVADINITLGTGDTAVPVPSVPNGIPVEWLGRCVSNPKVIVYPLGPNPGAPQAFPTIPGYDVTTTTGTPARYQTYTDSARNIHARSNGGTTFQCMTDGWIWHRGR